jgi:predicted nucleic acid-binding Zn ribbon protein
MVKAKFEIKRKCEVCGTMFYAKTIDSKYCCKKCTEIASKKKKTEKEKLAKMEELASNIPDSREYITVQEAIAMYSVSLHDAYILPS